MAKQQNIHCSFCGRVKEDVKILIAGADGHIGSPLAENEFTQVGYKAAAERVVELANKYANGRVLIGGAGGYQPYKETPETWANVVGTIYRGTVGGER
jgi:acetoin utilization deacetylase AcuC-like enzyme